MKYLTDKKRHLICVPYSIENLHTMAKNLNIGKHWFHKSHYDIPKLRIEEIEGKCEIVSPRDIVKIIQECKKKTTIQDLRVKGYEVKDYLIGGK